MSSVERIEDNQTVITWGGINIRVVARPRQITLADEEFLNHDLPEYDEEVSGKSMVLGQNIPTEITDRVIEIRGRIVEK